MFSLYRRTQQGELHLLGVRGNHSSEGIERLPQQSSGAIMAILVDSFYRRENPMQAESHCLGTMRLKRVSMTEWRIEGRDPTPLERVAMVQRVWLAGGTVLRTQEGVTVDVVQARERFAELTTQLMRVASEPSPETTADAAIRAGRACAQYLDALCPGRRIDVFEVLPGGEFGIRNPRVRELLVDGFAQVIRTSLDPDPGDRHTFRALGVYVEQERFVEAFRVYAERCWEERRGWLGASAEARLKGYGFKREQIQQARESRLRKATEEPCLAVAIVTPADPDEPPANPFTLDIVPDQASQGRALCLQRRETGLVIARTPEVGSFGDPEQQQDQVNLMRIAQMCDAYARHLTILREVCRTELFLQDHPQKIAAQYAARAAIRIARHLAAQWAVKDS
jgi:hypothetical protein